MLCDLGKCQSSERPPCLFYLGPFYLARRPPNTKRRCVTFYVAKRPIGAKKQQLGSVESASNGSFLRQRK